MNGSVSDQEALQEGSRPWQIEFLDEKCVPSNEGRIDMPSRQIEHFFLQRAKQFSYSGRACKVVLLDDVRCCERAKHLFEHGEHGRGAVPGPCHGVGHLGQLVSGHASDLVEALFVLDDVGEDFPGGYSRPRH